MAAFYLFSLSSKAANFLSSLYEISPLIQCRLMGRLCFLLALCSALDFYKRVFWAFMGFFFMGSLSSLKLLLTNNGDLGSGFLIFGCFAKFWEVLVVFFMFFLGFKVLQINGNCKIWSSNVCGGDRNLGKIDESVSANCGFERERRDSVVGEERETEEFCDADQVFDVMLLRKMVKAERQRANSVHCELEKERMAAASAADEAMAMILRLQNEKSALQMQANQLQRQSKEKQLYDQDLIHSLQWIILKHESERSLLEDQLRMCREKLRMYVKGEEWDQFDGVCPTPTPSATYSSSSNASRFGDMLVSALHFDSSPM